MHCFAKEIRRRCILVFFCGEGRKKGQKKVSPSWSAGQKRPNEFHCVGKVEGQTVEMLLDTGCSQILVHRRLVPTRKIDTGRRMFSRCVHGNILDYPTRP